MLYNFRNIIEIQNYFKSCQITLLITTIFYFTSFILTIITLYFTELKRFVMKYPLIYIISWWYNIIILSKIKYSFLLISLISLHKHPLLIRKYPYNYANFLSVFISALYIVIFICVYFRKSNSEIFLLNIIIIHTIIYLK
jgi:hypothetical protein